MARGPTEGLSPIAPGCPGPDFNICASLACPDLAILFLFFFPPHAAHVQQDSIQELDAVVSFKGKNLSTVMRRCD